MIEITQTALKVLGEGLKESGVDSESGLRISDGDENLTLELGRPETGDRVISWDGQHVLIIDPGVDERLGDAVIDVADTDEGPTLVVRTAG